MLYILPTFADELMRYCSRCLYPETKPDLWFTEAGLCSACVAFDARAKIDWDAKRHQFLDIVKSHRGTSHDVIVAASGGKDSTAQVVMCLEMGLRPLAVVATTDSLSWLGRENINNLAKLCDLIEVTPNVAIRRKIARYALKEVGDISWCEHQLIWSVPAREAAQRNIPIVLYGECPQNEYGAGPAGSEARDRMDQRWVHEFGGLLGLRLDDVVAKLDLPPQALELYRRPLDTKVQAVFMGAYFEWDGYENFRLAQKHGFAAYGKQVEGSGFTYENLDNCQTGLHDYLRWLKHAYGRATDIASNHIRRGRLTRADGIAHVNAWDGQFPMTYLGRPVSVILDEIGMSFEELIEVMHRFADPKLFKIDGNSITPLFEVA